MTDVAALPLDLTMFGGRTGHVIALGIRYVGHGADWVELALDYDRRLTSDLTTGILASGPIVSLFDSSFAAAIAARIGRLPTATLDLRVDYLRPAAPGEIVTVRGECYHLTRRIGFVRGIAHDGDATRPIAHATATFVLPEGDAV